VISDSIDSVREFYASLSAKQKAMALQFLQQQQSESEQQRQQLQATYLQNSQPGATVVSAITRDPAADQVPKGIYRAL
jgi:hypothetical protein